LLQCVGLVHPRPRPYRHPHRQQGQPRRYDCHK